MPKPFQFGIDALAAQDFAPLKGLRVGLLTNPSAVNTQLRTTYQILTSAPQVQVTALFAPEHGYLSLAPHSEHITHSRDKRTGLPVYSLYGETFKPTSDMLQHVDVIVCDIQDVGVRYYTYLWTLSYILEAAASHKKKVLILDRPNPLGDKVQGSPLDRDQESFVGRYPIPIQHGMTFGELALMMAGRWQDATASVEIILCEGWQRHQTWADLGLVWVSTSPNMPHFQTVQHYAGACLLEGTTLSEGRGTPLPFEIVGAPYIDAFNLADTLNQQQWAGVVFRPHVFRPTSSKYAGQDCYGVQAHITHAAQYEPIRTWLGVIQTIRTQYHTEFAWLPPHQGGLHGKRHFDRLIGTQTVRQQIDDGASLNDITQSWGDFCQQFRVNRQPYLRYT